jgi:hypothetical protein
MADAAGEEPASEVVEVVALVSVQLCGPSTLAATSGTDGRYAADQWDEGLAVMEVGGRDTDRQGQDVSVDDEVDFRSALATVDRIRSRQRPLLRTRTLTESIAHRDQSSFPREPSSSKTSVS